VAAALAEISKNRKSEITGKSGRVQMDKAAFLSERKEIDIVYPL